MIGTRQGPFHFTCPHCGARPTKPCIEPKGRRKGKTCKTHSQRVNVYRRSKGLDEVKVVWVNRVESKRSRH